MCSVYSMFYSEFESNVSFQSFNCLNIKRNQNINMRRHRKHFGCIRNLAWGVLVGSQKSRFERGRWRLCVLSLFDVLL